MLNNEPDLFNFGDLCEEWDSSLNRHKLEGTDWSFGFLK